MSRVRLRFIAVLLLVALLPSLPVALTVHALVRRTLDPVLEADLLGGAQAGLEAVRELLEQAKRRFEADILAGAPVDTLTASAIAALNERERGAILRLGAQAAPARSSLLVAPERLTLGGEEVLIARASTDTDRPVWVTRALDATLTMRATRLSESVRLVESLRRERDSVLRSLVFSFLLVYGVTLVIVVLIALFLASKVTRPVAALTEGIGRVATGDLDTRVPIVAGGEMGALLVSFNGMVERIRTQQSELLRLEKLAAWRQMARRLAHEIKNPLTPIQLAAQQMRDTYGGGDEAYGALVKEAAAIIEEEVDALRGLVSEFSEFARLPEPKREPVSVATLLADVGALYRSQVRVERVSQTLQVAGDREQLHRVLVNLVTNGLQAQDGAGVDDPLVLSVAESGDAVDIHVIDHGPGVPEAVRRRIFEPDVTTKSTGMGLGLAIVESTVRAHGGDVTVTDAPAGGADFRVRLPRLTIPTERGT